MEFVLVFIGAVVSLGSTWFLDMIRERRAGRAARRAERVDVLSQYFQGIRWICRLGITFAAATKPIRPEWLTQYETTCRNLIHLTYRTRASSEPATWKGLDALSDWFYATTLVPIENYLLTPDATNRERMRDASLSTIQFIRHFDHLLRDDIGVARTQPVAERWRWLADSRIGQLWEKWQAQRRARRSNPLDTILSLGLNDQVLIPTLTEKATGRHALPGSQTPYWPGFGVSIEVDQHPLPGPPPKLAH